MAGKIEDGKATAEEQVMHDVFPAIRIGNKVEKVEREGEVGWDPSGHGQSAASIVV